MLICTKGFPTQDHAKMKYNNEMTFLMRRKLRNTHFNVFISGRENRSKELKITESYRRNGYISSAGRKLVKITYGGSGMKRVQLSRLLRLTQKKARHRISPHFFFSIF